MTIVEPSLSAAYCGDVVCESVRGTSTLTTLYSRSPLKLMSPDHVGRAARVVMSSFGGGLVAGDEVPVRIRVGADAACVLTTQSASKIYRSDGRACSQSLTADIDENGALVVLPDPLCCYAGASYQQRQNFDLASPSSSLLWLDWLTSGRWAREERWEFESLSTRTDIHVDGRLRFREALLLDDRDGAVDGPLRMGRFDCYAVLVMIGPAFAPLIDVCEQTARAVPSGVRARMLASTTRIEDGVVMRVLGPRVQVVQDFLRQVISRLADVLGEDPWARKW